MFKLTAKNQNAEIIAGDSKQIVVTVTNTDGSLVDLTASTVKWAMKHNPVMTNVVYKDTTAGITISNATGGEFTIQIDPTDTTGLTGDFYHEAELTDQTGNVSTVMTGRITILASGV